VRTTRTVLTALVLALLLVAPVFGRPGRAAAQDDLRIAYVMHGLNDFTQVIKRGAEAAGRDLGVEVVVYGQAGFDIPTHQAFFETAIAEGFDGIVVIPNGGDPWNSLIQQATDAGIPLASANNTALNSPLDVWVGMDEYTSGQFLAAEMKNVFAAKGVTAGLIVVGMCALGNPVLVSRYQGFVDGMADTEFEITEAQDVQLSNEENYARWENLATANPDAVAMVGLCSLDIPNIAQIKERSGAEWSVGGYDIEVPTLDAIAAGFADVSIGQQPYLQGYMPVRILVEEIRNGVDVEGWFECPPDVVTAANVADYVSRESDPAVEYEYYTQYMAENFADLSQPTRPYSDLAAAAGGQAGGTPEA
jgi:simple sugar transport system substrate-binding protein